MSTKAQQKQWAEDIFSQLKWGKDRRSGFPKYWSWGITSRLFSAEPLNLLMDGDKPTEYKGKVWILFTVNGLIHSGYVYVVLTGADDYTVLIVKGKGSDQRIVKELEGIYCDELSSTIHREIEDAQD